MNNQGFSKKGASRVFEWPEATIENLKGCDHLEWIFYYSTIYNQFLRVDTNRFSEIFVSSNIIAEMQEKMRQSVFKINIAPLIRIPSATIEG